MPITGGFEVVVQRIRWRNLEKAKEALLQNKQSEIKRCKKLGKLLRSANDLQHREVSKHLAEEVKLWDTEKTPREHSDAWKAYCAYSNKLIARYLCPCVVKRIFGKEI